MVWLVVAIKLNRKQKVGDQEVKHLKLKMLLIIWKLNLLNIKFADAKKFIDYTLQHIFKSGFTPCKAEEPLRSMKLQKKEEEKD